MGRKTGGCGCGCVNWWRCGVACGWCWSEEGRRVNHKEVDRLYVEEKRGLRRKGGWKRASMRQPLPEPRAVKQVWSVDLLESHHLHDPVAA